LGEDGSGPGLGEHDGGSSGVSWVASPFAS
jgi:hypothetical protein